MVRQLAPIEEPSLFLLSADAQNKIRIKLNCNALSNDAHCNLFNKSLPVVCKSEVAHLQLLTSSGPTV